MLVIRFMRHDQPRRMHGFTLVELMTVAVIVIISLSMAAPTLRQFVQGQKVRAISQDLMSDLLLARSEALTRHAVVAVTPVNGDWSSGWSVTAAGQVLASRAGEAGSAALDGAPTAITFGVFGRVQAPLGRIRMTVRPPVSDASAQQQRCVELDSAGRPRTSYGPCVSSASRRR